jgi:glycosyltransferase involved in cell wall biosynthesis/Tfp pilus assembly protein PilF
MTRTQDGQSDSKITSDTTSNLLQTANDFLNKNDFEQAYPIVSRLAESEPTKIEYSHTAGLLAVTLQRPEEAKEHFRRVIKTTPQDYDANFNLALLELQSDNVTEAESILLELLNHYPDKVELYCDLGVVSMTQGNYAQAKQYFRSALDIDPGYTPARENLTEVEKQLSAAIPAATNESNLFQQQLSKSITGKKIVFFSNYNSFLADIVTHLKSENDVRTYEQPSPDRMKEMMDWADIAWFEWCDNLLIEATRLPKTCKIFCRLHSYEVFTDMPSQVNWQKVDNLLFVSQSVQDIFEKQVRCNTPKSVIFNGVDTDKFTIPSQKRYGKKIASVGYINYKKNPTLLLYCFSKIHQADPEYSLHIAGSFQDARIKLYFDHFLRENPLPVYFDDWVDDMPAWYADKDFVISTSLFESFHYSIAEGMASGVIPLIHNWYGASQLYPEQFMFNDPDECLLLVKKLETLDRKKLAEENRQYICDRYSVTDQCSAVSQLLYRVVEQSVMTDCQ